LILEGLANNVIKAIIADVDGVMVGKREGVNFPLPHMNVVGALRAVAADGIPVVLCSAKFHRALDGIIHQARLNNPHITDGGALIINPLGDKKIIEQIAIDKAVISQYLAANAAYTELYSADAYFVPKGEDPEFMAKRARLLQMEPTLVDSLNEVNAAETIIKIISYADDEFDIPRVEAQVKRLGKEVNYIWSHHPFIMPRQPCVMTAPGVSKEHAARDVARYLGVSFNQILGIGDSSADWSFVRLCGYAGVVGSNGELIKLALTKGHKTYLGKSVDDHGLLDILGHFGLL